MRFASNESEKQDLPVQNKVLAEDSLQTFASLKKVMALIDLCPGFPRTFQKLKNLEKNEIK